MVLFQKNFYFTGFITVFKLLMLLTSTEILSVILIVTIILYKSVQYGDLSSIYSVKVPSAKK